MSTSKERILRIVRLERELRACPDQELHDAIDALTPELREALQSPTNGCHLIEFVKGDSLQRLMIEASETEASRAREGEHLQLCLSAQ